MDTKPIRNQVIVIVYFGLCIAAALVAWPTYKFVADIVTYVSVIHSFGALN